MLLHCRATHKASGYSSEVNDKDVIIVCKILVQDKKTSVDNTATGFLPNVFLKWQSPEQRQSESKVAIGKQVLKPCINGHGGNIQSIVSIPRSRFNHAIKMVRTLVSPGGKKISDGQLGIKDKPTQCPMCHCQTQEHKINVIGVNQANIAFTSVGLAFITFLGVLVFHTYQQFKNKSFLKMMLEI